MPQPAPNNPQSSSATARSAKSTIQAKIERSSLGTADARAMRARTSTATARAIVARAAGTTARTTSLSQKTGRKSGG